MDSSYLTLRKAALAAAVAGIAFLATGCGEEAVEAEAPVRPVKTVTLGESEGTSTRTFPGTLRASERAQLSFRVSGPLVKLPIKEGSQVRKGDLLAQIDSRDFETAVQNLEAQLATLRAERRSMDQARPEDIRRAEADVAAARARLLEATANFRRYQRLYENDNVSKAEFDQRRAARDVAEADVATSEETLQIARSGARVEDIEAMEARIRALTAQLRMAQDDLEDTTLRAPYTGTVAERYVENFEFVRAQTPILSLQNTEIMELVAQIPETVVAGGRRENQSEWPDFYATFPSLPDQRVKAQITEIATEADAVTRTYSVIFQLPQPSRGTILAGMTGEIHLAEQAAGGAGFNVPSAAVFTDSGGEVSVWKVDSSGTISKVRVSITNMTGGSATIAEGVQAGDTIVTAGASFLSEGQRVRPITTELRERR
jgi:RND family efflux transporter MFP subunit